MKLSPFGNLVFLLIAHPPHSFAKHVLHKRMERQSVDGLREEKATLSTPQTDPATFKPLDAPNASHKHQTVPVDDNHFHVEPPNYPPFMVPPHYPKTNMMGSSNVENKKKLSLDDETYTRKKSSTNSPDALHEHQTIPADKISSTPGLFSHISDLEQTFSNLHLHEDIEGLIKRIVDQITTQHTPDSCLYADPSLHSHKEVSRLIEHIKYKALSVNEYLTDEASKINEELASRSGEIRELLQPIDSDVHDFGVVGWLGSQISVLNSRQLTEARKTIEDALGSSSYLSSLCGLLGPGDLYYFRIMHLIRDFPQFKELPEDIPKNIPCFEFVSHIQDLNSTFKRLLETAVDGSPPPESRQNFIEEFASKMTEFENNWISIFGTRQALIDLIRDIEQSDLVKSLQVDYMNPTDLAGFELAFVEPFGIGNHVPPPKLLSDLIGLPSAEKIYPNFYVISQRANKNMELRIPTALKALKLKNEFLDHFTPNGQKIFLARLKEANQAIKAKKFKPPIDLISFIRFKIRVWWELLQDWVGSSLKGISQRK